MRFSILTYFLSLMLCFFLLACKEEASKDKQVKHQNVQEKVVENRHYLVPFKLLTKSSTSSLDDAYPVKVKDDRGSWVELSKAPQRIVVGGTPLYTEIVFDLQAQKRLVGITDSKDNPSEAKSIPRIGKSWPLNIEKVVSLHPDLVLCAYGPYRLKLEKDTNIKVFTGGQRGGYIHSLEDIYLLIQKIDKLLYGTEQRSKKVIEKIKSELHLKKSKVKSKLRPSVAVVYMMKAQSSQVYIIGGKGSPGSELLRLAGARNVFEKQKKMVVSIELLLTENPDILITAPKQLAFIKKHRVLRHLKAVRNQQVYTIPASQYTSSRVLRVFDKLQGILQTFTKSSK